MPKRSDKSVAADEIERHRLIRHHLEEAAVHLGMVKSILYMENPLPQSRLKGFEKVGTFLRQTYFKYGGHPDA